MTSQPPVWRWPNLPAPSKPPACSSQGHPCRTDETIYNIPLENAGQGRREFLVESLVPHFKERKIVFATYPSIPLPWKAWKGQVPRLCCQGGYCCFLQSVRVPCSNITELRKDRVAKWVLFLETGLPIWSTHFLADRNWGKSLIVAGIRERLMNRFGEVGNLSSH